MSDQEKCLHEVDGHKFETHEEYREYLSTSGKYSNVYKPWTPELDDELKELAKIKSVRELALYFKRESGGIKSRLEKLNIDHPEKYIKNASQILTAIIDGCNPLTGELFQNESIWSHPRIKEDLNNWINDHLSLNKKNHKTKTPPKSKFSQPNTIKEIKDVLFEEHKIEVVMIQIGGWFEVMEECGKVLNTELGYKEHDGAGKRSYMMVRFPRRFIEKVQKTLEEKTYTFCFVTETHRDDSRVSREVTISSNKEIIGMKFEHELQKKTYSPLKSTPSP